jgi:hypothetical protein
MYRDVVDIQRDSRADWGIYQCQLSNEKERHAIQSLACCPYAQSSFWSCTLETLHSIKKCNHIA